MLSVLLFINSFTESALLARLGILRSLRARTSTRRIERRVVDIADKFRETLIFFPVIQRADFALGR